jgi:uncharacterized membrane protein
MIELTHSGTALLTAFLASLVECVEALTIVLAVGIVRGWRSALAGTALGTVLLVLLIAVFGPSLSLIPLGVLQVAIGILLLLFGMRWLRKAVLRNAGIIALRDETAAYRRETEALRDDGTQASSDRRWDVVGVAASFKAVMLEGAEVVFIVIAVGAVGNALVPASLGAVAAAGLVASLGVLVHRPLARVPENALKFAVGIMLSSFGAFWLGEGYGFSWPGADLAILVENLVHSASRGRSAG